MCLSSNHGFYFKGTFRIYRTPMAKGFEKPDPIYGTFKGLPSSEPTKVIVRVYVVRCTDLQRVLNVCESVSNLENRDETF